MSPKKATKNNPKMNVPPVVLVNTTAKVPKESCKAGPGEQQFNHTDKPAREKGSRAALKDWLDHVILPILIGDIFHDNSGEFSSRGISDAIRYIRALFIKPAVARVDC